MQHLLAVRESTSTNNIIDWPLKHVVKGNTLQDLACYVYNSLYARLHPPSYFNEQAILAARNNVVSNLNTQLL